MGGSLTGRPLGRHTQGDEEARLGRDRRRALGAEITEASVVIAVGPRDSLDAGVLGLRHTVPVAVHMLQLVVLVAIDVGVLGAVTERQCRLHEKAGCEQERGAAESRPVVSCDHGLTLPKLASDSSHNFPRPLVGTRPGGGWPDRSRDRAEKGAEGKGKWHNLTRAEAMTNADSYAVFACWQI